ncbi:SPOR domain-containing protein [Qipengyuania sp. MTN3-11]|uniref:SPOR domain-containing protein n=1 Tax=Qipengyuania sp. MTN3-11 TaxID=3056557 RepID=UPI0036F3CF0B
MSRGLTRAAMATMAGAIALGMLATPAMADVKAGVDAWSAGDYATAVREWAEPAAQGDPDAQFNLAQAYRLGRGVEADPKQAEALYLLAANQGHVKAADNYGLLLFQDGRREAALPYVQAAAERGDPRGQYLLGVAHFNGDLVEKDWVRAYALATLANSAGLPQARAAMAQMDEFIPMEQRQEAQVLARTLATDAQATRASDLAAVDLATGGVPAREVQPRVAGRVDEAAPSPPAPKPAPKPAPAPVVVARNAASDAPGADYTLPAAPAPAAANPSEPRQASAQPAPVAPPAASAATPAARMTGAWKVQLGAFGVAGSADRLWDRLAGNTALVGAAKIKEPAGRLTKLLAGGFASEADARRACAALKAGGQECLVTR